MKNMQNSFNSFAKQL